MVIITGREGKAVQYTTERLKQSLGNRRGGRKKKLSYSSSIAESFHSSMQNLHVGTASQITPEIEFSANPTARKFRTAGFA